MMVEDAMPINHVREMEWALGSCEEDLQHILGGLKTC
jgi:hypothetical protein